MSPSLAVSVPQILPHPSTFSFCDACEGAFSHWFKDPYPHLDKFFSFGFMNIVLREDMVFESLKNKIISGGSSIFRWILGDIRGDIF